jgi:hypothetical protein
MCTVLFVSVSTISLRSIVVDIFFCSYDKRRRNETYYYNTFYDVFILSKSGLQNTNNFLGIYIMGRYSAY